MGPLLHVGLALATTISSILNLVVLALIISSRVGKVIDGRLAISFMKSLAAAVITALVAYSVTLLGEWELDGVTVNKVTVLAASIASGFVAYFISSLLLRSEEAGYVLRALREKSRS